MLFGQAEACPRPLRGPAVPGCKVIFGHGGGLSAARVMVPGNDTRERRGRQTEQPPPGDQVGPRVVRPDRQARERLGGALCRPAGRGFFGCGDQATRLGRALCGPTGRRGKGRAARSAARPRGAFSAPARGRRIFSAGASRRGFSGLAGTARGRCFLPRNALGGFYVGKIFFCFPSENRFSFEVGFSVFRRKLEIGFDSVFLFSVGKLIFV